MRRTAALCASLLIAACSQEKPAAETAIAPAPVAEAPAAVIAPGVIRALDPVAGRALFVEKGCVICHSVNGVGGKAAPALDSEIGAEDVDPLDFAARMWRGAPAMIELQSVELGYTIYLTADDIANLAAFAADRDAQRLLTADALPESIRNGLLDERFWELENWEEVLSNGREIDFDGDGAVEPEEPAETE